MTRSDGTPRIAIAGAASGVGKTTVAAGVMAALHRQGLIVQPFRSEEHTSELQSP